MPDDIEDEYSPIKEYRYEIQITILKSSISCVTWFYSDSYEIYKVEMNYGSESWDLNMESRDMAIELYNNIKNWLLK